MCRCYLADYFIFLNVLPVVGDWNGGHYSLVMMLIVEINCLIDNRTMKGLRRNDDAIIKLRLVSKAMG